MIMGQMQSAKCKVQNVALGDDERECLKGLESPSPGQSGIEFAERNPAPPWVTPPSPLLFGPTGQQITSLSNNRNRPINFVLNVRPVDASYASKSSKWVLGLLARWAEWTVCEFWPRATRRFDCHRPLRFALGWETSKPVGQIRFW